MTRYTRWELATFVLAVLALALYLAWATGGVR